MPTLPLPSLSLVPSEVATKRKSPIKHLCLVVGGTGVTAALQLLRHVANPEGPFGAKCQATLLYSSRSAPEVLLVDELRAVEAAASGRILVRHTLSDAQANAMSLYKLAKEDNGAHNFHSLSPWKPYEHKSGPLRTAAADKEAGLRGRVADALLQELFPAASPGVQIVVCGPPLMWEDVRSMAMGLGYASDAL